MTYLKTVGGPGVAGLHPQEIVVTAKNAESSTAFVAGDVVQFEFISGTGLPGAEASGFYSVKTPLGQGSANAQSNRKGGVVGVCQEAIAAGATGKVMVAGITNAKTATAAKGDYLVHPGAQTTLALANTSTATLFKIVGITLAITGTGPLGTNTATFPTVWFEGIHGFGVD